LRHDQTGSDDTRWLSNSAPEQQQDMPVLHNTASPMEQQQQPQTVSMQHASEQPGVQQPQPPLQTALSHHSSEQQIMQQQDAGQLVEHPPEDTKQQAPAWQSYSSVFTAAKAGMGGVDQAKVKQVVYEMSKVIWMPPCTCACQDG
jgi:DNA repair exonuclease SbcCD nuclease subunit